MKTAKEEAQELFDSFYNVTMLSKEAKQCALITIDKIIDATTKRWGGINPTTGHQVNHVQVNPYYQEVKQELEKL